MDLILNLAVCRFKRGKRLIFLTPNFTAIQKTRTKLGTTIRILPLLKRILYRATVRTGSAIITLYLRDCLPKTDKLMHLNPPYSALSLPTV